MEIVCFLAGWPARPSNEYIVTEVGRNMNVRIRSRLDDLDKVLPEVIEKVRGHRLGAGHEGARDRAWERCSSSETRIGDPLTRSLCSSLQGVPPASETALIIPGRTIKEYRRSMVVHFQGTAN